MANGNRCCCPWWGWWWHVLLLLLKKKPAQEACRKQPGWGCLIDACGLRRGRHRHFSCCSKGGRSVGGHGRLPLSRGSLTCPQRQGGGGGHRKCRKSRRKRKCRALLLLLLLLPLPTSCRSDTSNTSQVPLLLLYRSSLRKMTMLSLVQKLLQFR